MKNIISKHIYNIIFFIIAVVHFTVILLKFPTVSPNFLDLGLSNKIVYIIVKMLSFICITAIWQLIPICINILRTKNKKGTDYIKFTLFYFLINIIILYFTYPYMALDYELVDIVSDIGASNNYQIVYMPHYFQWLQIAVFYNIIPSIAGITALTVFMYSLVFSFVISELKYQLNSKAYFLSIIPFLIPFILIMNQNIIRHISIAWLLLFILFYIYINQQKRLNNIIPVILFGIISAVTVEFRTEYIILLLLLPVMVFHLKIFSKKMALLFTVLFLVFFSAFHYIQDKHLGSWYKLHNFSFLYEKYIQNKDFDKDIENNRYIFEYIYPYINKADFSYEKNNIINTDNKKYCNKAMFLLTKFALKRVPYLIDYNINYPKHTDMFMFFYPSRLKANYINTSGGKYLSKSLFTENRSNERIAKFLLYGNFTCDYSNILKLIYNHKYIISALIFILLYGIIRLKPFYLYSFLIFLIIYLLALIFIPMRIISTYYYSVIFNSLILISITAATEINKLISLKK